MRIVLAYEHIQRLRGAHSHVVVELARRLQQRGHDVTIICDTVVDPDLFPDLHFIARRAWKQGESHRLALLYHWAGPIARSLRPDVTLSFHPAAPADFVVPTFGWISTRLRREHEFLRRPLRHYGLQLHPNIIDRRYVEARLRRCCRRGRTTLVALGTTMRELLLADHPELTERTVVVPGASPFEPPQDAAECRAERRRFRRMLGLEDDDVVVLWAGRLGLNHGLGPAMRAFARVADAAEKRRSGRGRLRMVIAGDGAWPAHDRAVMVGCPERFIHLGRVHNMEQVLAGCDLGLIPSIHSLYGRLVWECLAFGRPVITTARSGGVDRLRSGDGELPGAVVPPGDVHVLAEAILRLCGDADALARATAAAERIAPQMGFDAFTDRIEHLLRSSRAGSDAIDGATSTAPRAVDRGPSPVLEVAGR